MESEKQVNWSIKQTNAITLRDTHAEQACWLENVNFNNNSERISLTDRAFVFAQYDVLVLTAVWWVVVSQLRWGILSIMVCHKTIKRLTMKAKNGLSAYWREHSPPTASNT